ncbi:MAG TPA: hypothetical protein DEA08_20495 [Planctomycetes bacterium]|nr:hypothetical protein [Planctomycetota bacterium]
MADTPPTTDAGAGQASSPAGEAAGPSDAGPSDAGTVTDSGPVDEDLLAAVRERQQALSAMPDGPRPKPEGLRYKRRKILVDWNLQISYVGVYLATLTLLVVGFLALNMIFASLYKRALAIQVHRPFDDETNLLFLGVLNVVFVLLLVIGMAVYAIIQSHRVAGPALRFRRALHALHRRDYDWYLRLRSKDYLQDIAEQVNGLNNALKAKDVVIADALLELESLAKDKPELAERLAEVSANLSDVVLPLPMPEGEEAPPRV